MHNNVEVFAILGCYETYVDICLPSFNRTVFKGQAVQTESSWTVCTLKLGPIGFAEMSVNNYKHLLPKNQEEHRLNIHHGRSLKSQRSFKSTIFYVRQNHKWISMHIIHYTTITYMMAFITTKKCHSKLLPITGTRHSC
jgi:hypothetical protein